jgi:hypothetical protein
MPLVGINIGPAWNKPVQPKRGNVMKKPNMAVLAVCLVFGLLIGLAAGCSPQSNALPGQADENGLTDEAPSGGETGGAESGQTEGANECPFPEGLVLPQIYILGRIYYAQADLDALQTQVIGPLIDYFESLGQTVVSIQIDSDNRGSSAKTSFLFDVIVSNNDGDHDPIYLGFVHDKVDGEIPLWVMETLD